MINNFNYGSNVGSANFGSAAPYNPVGAVYWASDFGAFGYHTATPNWTYAPLGAASLQLGYQYDSSGNIGAQQEDLVYGETINIYDTVNNIYNFQNPNLPVTAVPEPAAFGVIGMASLQL